ncbi:MAG: DUF4116 domain-containing protein [Candidatus Rhabdochlamydia sp.]
MSCQIPSNIFLYAQKTSSNFLPSTISLQEGKRLLQQLIPGSFEHAQLQTIFLKTAGIFEITVKGTSYKIDTVSHQCKLLGGFGGSEHAAIGEAISLQGLEGDQTVLTVGSHQLKFSHIVALAGDFYAIPGEAISLPGGDDNAKTVRFQNAFNTLVKADHEELKAILAEIAKESREVKESGTPHHCYSHCTAKGMHALKQIKKDYQELLIDNSDHFEKNAEDAYRIGHTLALQVAKEAGHTQNLEKLKEAYALDAFACHFLTDLFAAGHIRNQRGDLEVFLREELKFSPGMSKKLAGVLTGAQHEEDGNNGLDVQNQEGKTWRSYGDGFYFSPKSRENKERVIEAAQRSADEIYMAYSHPDDAIITAVHMLIPRPLDSNPYPLYAVKENTLILYNGHTAHPVKKGIFSSKDILSHALKYLPQSYINGFILPEQELSPWVSKLISPQLTRIMGACWSMIGAATYHQVHAENRQLNTKIDEMAATVKKVYDNTNTDLDRLYSINAAIHQQINIESRQLNTKIDAIAMTVKEVYDHATVALDELYSVRVALSRLLKEDCWKEFRKAESKIKDVLHGYQYLPKMWFHQQEEQLKKLSNALNTLSRFCMETDETGRGALLANYKKELKKDLPNATDDEIQILTTLWFRQLLELQAQAIAVYHLSTHLDGGIKEFETILNNQLEINKSLLDETLVMSSSHHILQYEMPNIPKQLAIVQKDGLALERASEALKNNKQIVLAAVKNNWQALKYANDKLKDDPDVVLAAIEKSGYALEYASARLKNDKEFILPILKKHDWTFEFISDELKDDLNIARIVLEEDGWALQYVSERLKKDKPFILNTLERVEDGLEYVSEAFQDDLDIVLLSIKKSGREFRYASERLRNDPTIVLTAVKGYGEALEHASTRLKNDREFVLTAMKIDGSGLKHVSETLKNDPEIVLAAVKTSLGAFKYASEELKNNREFALKAIQEHESSFYYVNENLKNDKKFIFSALERNGLVLEYMSTTLKNDKEIVLAAVKENEEAFEYASDELKNNPDFVLANIQNIGWTLQYVSASLKNNKTFILEVVKKNGMALMHVSDALKKDEKTALAAVNNNELAFYYVNKELKNNEEFMLTALKNNDGAFFYASEELKSNRKFILKAIQINKKTFYHISQALKNDPEIILAAEQEKWMHYTD